MFLRAACLFMMLALAAPSGVAWAQLAAPQAAPTVPPFDAARAHAIDAIAAGELHAGSTPGLAIGVVEDGLLVYARGFGWANQQRHRRMTPNTQMPIGSLTRQFTAAAVLLLQQRGKLSLSDPVTKYIPDLTIAEHVTVAQLLTDTSGLPDALHAPGIDRDLRRPVAMAALLRAADRMKPAFAPGARFQYNNFNYMVAGAIVQRVTQLPLSVFFASNIFQPLIMSSSFVLGDQGISPARAVGYTRSSKTFVPAARWNPSWLLGDGDVITTVADLAKWDVGMPLLLNVDSVRTMWSAPQGAGGSPLGMGWVVDERGGQRFVWMNGEISGFHSMNALLPAQHVAVIVLANADSLGSRATVQPELIANRILDVVAPLPPVHVANPIVMRATEWLGRLARDEIDRTQLTPAFSEYLTDDVVEHANLASMGSLRSIYPTESYQQSGNTVYLFEAKFQRGSLRYQLTLAPDGKIAGILLLPG